MAKIKSKKSERNLKCSKDDSKLFAFLATFLSIIGFIIAIIVKKDDKYVMFYAKQSLVIFIVAIIAGAISSILNWIPGFGFIIAGVLNIIVLVLWVISWIYALSGERREVPIIGPYAESMRI